MQMWVRFELRTVAWELGLGNGCGCGEVIIWFKGVILGLVRFVFGWDWEGDLCVWVWRRRGTGDGRESFMFITGKC